MHHYRIRQIVRAMFALLLMVVMTSSLLPAAPALAQSPSVRYLVIAKADTLPSGLTDQVVAAGGTISAALQEVGLISVESSNPNFVATVSAIKEVQSVVPDVLVPWVSAEDVAALNQDFTLAGRDFTYTGQDFAFTGRDFTFTGRDFTFTGRDFTFTGRDVTFGGQDSTSLTEPQDDYFFPFQWNMLAIHAPEAWAAGARGRGVRVAVLDAGFELIHPDFFWFNPATGPVNNIDAASGANFVPGEALQFNNSLPVSSHATHIAGIIAAADNGIGVIGVAPESTIVPIKVLRDADLQGDFAWIIQGIYYAANLQGAQAVDVINMSLGAAVYKNGWCDASGACVTKKDVKELTDALKRAIKYADKQGITVVAAAGNTYPGDPTMDMDHVGDLLFIPADTKGVITVSATGPNGWGLNSNADLDMPAFYSRYGKSYVDFAAPGGNVDLAAATNPSSPLWGPCLIGGFPVNPCGTADLVPSTLAANQGGWGWLYGTSMATPHVAGVMALVIGQNGGEMKPDKVESTLKKSADDLNKLGLDDFYDKPDFYGDGRVNAYNAVR